jgi:hypothetical protein
MSPTASVEMAHRINPLSIADDTRRDEMSCSDPLIITCVGNHGLGAPPVEVYVQMASDDTGKLVPQFAQGPITDTTIWYNGGITWKVPTSNDNPDLVILLHPWGPLVAGYAIPLNPNVKLTTHATLSAAGSTTTTLWVVNAFGTTHDPKIVVTPQ